MQHLNTDEFLKFYFYTHGEIIDLGSQKYSFVFNMLKSYKNNN
jgi:hypothetical protein